MDQAALEEAPEAVPEAGATSLLAAFAGEAEGEEVNSTSLEEVVESVAPEPRQEERPLRKERFVELDQPAVAIGLVKGEVPQVDALEVVVVVAAFVGARHCPWNPQGPLPPVSSEHLPDAPPEPSSEVVEVVAIALEGGNTWDPAGRIPHFQHSQIWKAMRLHPCLEERRLWIFLGEVVAALASVVEAAEAENLRVGKEVEGVAESLELDEAVEEGPALVMAMESHSHSRSPHLRKEVEAAVEGVEGEAPLNPGPCPSHHLDLRHQTREFEDRWMIYT